MTSKRDQLKGEFVHQVCIASNGKMLCVSRKVKVKNGCQLKGRTKVKREKFTEGTTKFLSMNQSASQSLSSLEPPLFDGKICPHLSAIVKVL